MATAGLNDEALWHGRLKISAVGLSRLRIPGNCFLEGEHRLFEFNTNEFICESIASLELGVGSLRTTKSFQPL